MKLDPRQVKSKEKLHEAYLSLRIEGHDQLSIQQICTKAEVTRPTFYKLYKDIHELRTDLIAQILREMKQALTINNPMPLAIISKEEMPKHLTYLFEHVQRNHIAYETLLIYKPDALFIDGIQSIMKEYIKDGLHFSQTKQYLIPVEGELLNAYLVGAYIESLRWWITTNYQMPPLRLAEVLIELALNGPYVKRMT